MGVRDWSWKLMNSLGFMILVSSVPQIKSIVNGQRIGIDMSILLHIYGAVNEDAVRSGDVAIIVNSHWLFRFT